MLCVRIRAPVLCSRHASGHGRELPSSRGRPSPLQGDSKHRGRTSARHGRRPARRTSTSQMRLTISDRPTVRSVGCSGGLLASSSEPTESVSSPWAVRISLRHARIAPKGISTSHKAIWIRQLATMGMVGLMAGVVAPSLAPGLIPGGATACPQLAKADTAFKGAHHRENAINVPSIVSEHHQVSGSGTTAECLVGEPTCQPISTITMANHHS
jgi:hypothetical protein